MVEIVVAHERDESKELRHVIMHDFDFDQLIIVRDHPERTRLHSYYNLLALLEADYAKDDEPLNITFVVGPDEALVAYYAANASHFVNKANALQYTHAQLHEIKRN